MYKSLCHDKMIKTFSYTFDIVTACFDKHGVLYLPVKWIMGNLNNNNKKRDVTELMIMLLTPLIFVYEATIC